MAAKKTKQSKQRAGKAVAGNGVRGQGLGRRVVPDVPAAPDPGPSKERVEFVTRLMLAGLPLGQIVEQAARSVGLDNKGTRLIYDRLCDSWTQNVEQDLKHSRAQAINRLRRDLAQIRNPGPLRAPHTGEVLTEAVLDANGQRFKRGGVEVRQPILNDTDWKAVNAHERLLASIEGTLRPVEVAVDVTVSQRRSLAVLISSLSETEIVELEEEQRLLEEGAVPARR